MSIIDIVRPIKLLQGHHSDTGQTGSGCAMDVIAYLNGDEEITDGSPCVCVTVRPILIFLNDRLEDDQRYLLIPYIERAMGSATDNSEIIRQRLAHIVIFAKCVAEYAEYAAEYTAEYAVKYAAKSAEYAAECAAEYAAECAAKYAESAKCAARRKLIQPIFDLLDDILPHSQHNEIVMKRAQKLVAIAEANHA